MLSFKEFITEGVFAAHNAHVIHKHLMKAVEENKHLVAKIFRNGNYADYNAKDLHPDLPDMTIRLAAVGAPHGKKGDDVMSAGYQPKEGNQKPRIRINIGFDHDQFADNPDHIVQQLGNVNHRAAFVHEFIHHDTDQQLRKGPAGDLKALTAGQEYDQQKSQGPKGYYNIPDEVRAFHHQIAYTHRENKKAGTTPRLHPSEENFIKHTDPKNVLPIRNYLRRLHGLK